MTRSAIGPCRLDHGLHLHVERFGKALERSWEAPKTTGDSLSSHVFRMWSRKMLEEPLRGLERQRAHLLADLPGRPGNRQDGDALDDPELPLAVPPSGKRNALSGGGARSKRKRRQLGIQQPTFISNRVRPSHRSRPSFVVRPSPCSSVPSQRLRVQNSSVALGVHDEARGPRHPDAEEEEGRPREEEEDPERDPQAHRRPHVPAEPGEALRTPEERSPRG